MELCSQNVGYPVPQGQGHRRNTPWPGFPAVLGGTLVAGMVSRRMRFGVRVSP